jgi:16S rRNA (cytidine1402-2'-O)-methyltransferase
MTGGRKTGAARGGIIVARVNGRLQVIATPIGNLADLSERARAALAQADVVAAEDTRHTGMLLKALGLSRPLVSLHEHNESQRAAALLARLAAGETIALVSDAGMPLISDPGFSLVREAVRAGVTVSVIPGPSAITAALAVAALPTDRFCFEGFLPARERERRTRLADLAHEPRTLVFFEAPHRIAAALAELAAQLGDERQAVVARELTKAHETVYRGTLRELARRAQSEENFARGEITLVVHGAAIAQSAVDEPLLRRAVQLLSRELPPAKVAAIAAQLTGATRAAAYALATRGAAGGADATPPPAGEEVP